jgi:hypothetical protein
VLVRGPASPVYMTWKYPDHFSLARPRPFAVLNIDLVPGDPMAAESMNYPRRMRCCALSSELISESVCIFHVGGVVDSSAGARRTVATVSSTGDLSVSTLSMLTHEVLSCMETAPIVRGTSASRCVGAIEPTRVPARTKT